MISSLGFPWRGLNLEKSSAMILLISVVSVKKNIIKIPHRHVNVSILVIGKPQFVSMVTKWKEPPDFPCNLPRLIYLIVGSLTHTLDLQFSPFRLPVETTVYVLQDFLNYFAVASIITAGRSKRRIQMPSPL